MGTPEFAVPSLEILVNNGFEIAAVVTAPDKPAGRGQSISQSAVKRFALSRNLPVLQPERLKDEGFLSALRALKADLQVVVAFRMLPEVVWNMPPLGTINLHASLLPAYRGAAPINWAIINGEKETGITTFKLQHEIDSGQILLQQKIVIGETMNAGDLHDEMMKRGAELLLRTVKLMEGSLAEGTALPALQQDESKVSHAPKIFRDTCRIGWQAAAQRVHNLVRGLSPYPAAYTVLVQDGREWQLKIFSSRLCADEGRPAGSCISDGRTFLKIQCGQGALEVLELQIEGKKRMSTEDFLRGFKLSGDVKFV